MKQQAWVPYREHPVMARDFADKLRIARLAKESAPEDREHAVQAAAWLIHDRHPETFWEESSAYLGIGCAYTTRMLVKAAPANAAAMALAERWRKQLPEAWKVRRMSVRHVAEQGLEGPAWAARTVIQDISKQRRKR